jgi:acyl carrier protein
LAQYAAVVPGRDPIVETIREVILTRWPGRFDDGTLRDEASLGAEGLGLDSIEIVELLSACEDRLGLSTTPELFEVVPLTIDRVADHFAAQ